MPDPLRPGSAFAPELALLRRYLALPTCRSCVLPARGEHDEDGRTAGVCAAQRIEESDVFEGGAGRRNGVLEGLPEVLGGPVG